MNTTITDMNFNPGHVQNIYIMIGIIGSGKSSWARDKAKNNDNMVIVDRDALRYMVKGGKYIFDEKYEEMIRSVAFFCLRYNMEKGFDIIIDETNITMAKRVEWLDIIKHTTSLNIVKVTYVWCTETERNLDFRMQKPRGYSKGRWSEVYDEMIEAFEPPTIDELPPDGDIIKYKIPNEEK